MDAESLESRVGMAAEAWAAEETRTLKAATRVARTADDADDLVASVCAKFYSAVQTRRLRDARSYCRAILRGELADYVNNQKRERLVGPMRDIGRGSFDVACVARIDLRNALRTLPAGLQRLVYARYFVGMRLLEYAQMTGQPLTTVSSQHQRALCLLRAKLKEDEPS